MKQTLIDLYIELNQRDRDIYMTSLAQLPLSVNTVQFTSSADERFTQYMNDSLHQRDGSQQHVNLIIRNHTQNKKFPFAH